MNKYIAGLIGLTMVVTCLGAPERLVDAEYAKSLVAEQEAQKLDRWVLENQYILACDQLRGAMGQAPTQTKLGFAELVPMMQTLRVANRDAYEMLRDTMDMLNTALFRHDIQWWNTCVWHPEVAN
jgi:hypothetical protein